MSSRTRQYIEKLQKHGYAYRRMGLMTEINARRLAELGQSALEILNKIYALISFLNNAFYMTILLQIS